MHIFTQAVAPSASRLARVVFVYREELTEFAVKVFLPPHAGSIRSDALLFNTSGIERVESH